MSYSLSRLYSTRRYKAKKKKQKLILPFQENKSRLCSLCKCKIEEKEFMIRKNKDLFHLDCFKKIKIVKGRDEGRID